MREHNNDTTMRLVSRARNYECTSIVIVERWVWFSLQSFVALTHDRIMRLLVLLLPDQITFLPKKERERMTIACRRTLPQNE